MRKILFISTLFIVVFLVIALFSFFSRISTTNAPTATPKTTTPAPIPSGQIPASDTLDISDTTVKNFYKNAPRIDKQRDVYIIEEPQKYRILYMERFSQFQISILGSPFKTIRTQAEQKLLEKLNVSQADACSLNVVITTPSFANPDYAGKNYKLSFCE